MEPPPALTPPDPPTRVMLLSLWVDAGGPWHARLVDGEARVHSFDSPFELARYLCAPAPRPAPGPGLR